MALGTIWRRSSNVAELLRNSAQSRRIGVPGFSLGLGDAAGELRAILEDKCILAETPLEA